MTAALPQPRGPLSQALIDALGRERPGEFPEPVGVADADAFGDDLQLALYLCYELHYQGFHGVDADWEWDSGLLRLRAAMERVFLAGLRAGTTGGQDVEGELDELLVDSGGGVSGFLADDAEWWQVCEYFAHRSIYHLKEADPHAWAIPRLRGRAKAALVAVEFDEFGGGRAERVHAQLYEDVLAAAGLETGYLHYLDQAPACMLAIVNLMSAFGLHRGLRGALVGHFGTVEITSSPSVARIDAGLERLGAPEACRAFYLEHIEADAVHEQVLRRDVIGGLLESEPELAGDVVFGIQATGLLEDRFAEHVLTSWRDGQTSLRALRR
ncbi:iron-containing redox enzyme family protein [Amycolatopsis sp. K13G38]|uniref:Iron-containing redox enzyme family protein n=1 Tax=Amycolatopsis acididurans TaxID=2724524 RepID=A0ABX1J0W5_9PSEU|nr:iron-containing redox enzyme family protein [Amycolatopsis acididurans]NKQ53036.1 iron-containing redox enzyme family protein [Amycolatopsis acididurans]